MGEHLAPLERSLGYRGFAEAFRTAGGGRDVLDPELVPPAGANGARAFVEAFDPSVSGQACSLYASSYLKRAQNDLFEELVRWYDHFGLRRLDTAELPDHVSVELEFAHFLAFSEYQQSGDEEAAKSLRRAELDFLERHLSPVAANIAEAFKSPDPRCGALVRGLPDFLKLCAA